ncbi:MAG TPA: hypothetical protein VMT53_26650 [Terriglobales bacterium]|nr:hypothetical protein [Terriglobales bacterium]
MSLSTSNVGGELPTLGGVTPLYGFSTDVDPLVITNSETITKSTEEHLSFFHTDDVFLRHIGLYQPQHFIWHKVELSPDEIVAILRYVRGLGTDVLRGDITSAGPFGSLLHPVSDFLRALHVFKPGRLIAGDTSFFMQMQGAASTTLCLSRCSEMTIDFQFVQEYHPHYEFNEDDVLGFLKFMVHFYKARLKSLGYPQIDLALWRYAKETSLYGDPVELMISLEALLVPEEEGIAFRLAQRVANLLGGDATTRKELFRQMRDFYGLRSKTVHGAMLRKRDATALQQVDSLREITRRVLLSVMALAADIGLEQDLYTALNDACFDDELRQSIQSKAAALLHC